MLRLSIIMAEPLLRDRAREKSKLLTVRSVEQTECGDLVNCAVTPTYRMLRLVNCPVTRTDRMLRL